MHLISSKLVARVEFYSFCPPQDVLVQLHPLWQMQEKGLDPVFLVGLSRDAFLLTVVVICFLQSPCILFRLLT